MVLCKILDQYDGHGVEVNQQLQLYGTWDVVQWKISQLHYWIFIKTFRYCDTVSRKKVNYLFKWFYL